MVFEKDLETERNINITQEEKKRYEEAMPLVKRWQQVKNIKLLEINQNILVNIVSRYIDTDSSKKCKN